MTTKGASGAAQGRGTCDASCTTSALVTSTELDDEPSTNGKRGYENSIRAGLANNDSRIQSENDSEPSNSPLDLGGNRWK